MTKLPPTLKARTTVIFVEGIPGSGKSTFAQRLSFHLQKCGYRARWHHENDRNHPAIAVGTPNEWDFHDVERRLAGWKQFIAQATAGREIVILESALLQKQLNRYVKERKESELPVLFDPLYRILKKAQPVLIQLRQSSIQSHFQWLSTVRRDALSHFARIAKPFAARDDIDDLSLICAYYSRIQKVSANYAKRFPGQVIVLNQANNDWIGSFNQICRKFGVPEYTPARIPRHLISQLSGTYKRDDGIELVVVEAKGGRLQIKHDGDLDLVDRERLLFFIDNRPDEIRFELASGAVPKLRMGAGTMVGTGTHKRTVPDRFTVDRVFSKLH